VIKSAIAGLVILCAICAATARAEVDKSSFRYTRELAAMWPGAVAFEPDSALLGHARVGLADLRLVDANDREVPWRPMPIGGATSRAVDVLNGGRSGNAAVALLDLGPRRSVHDRVVLDVPGKSFVARVTVRGADGRDGPFTLLGATTIYDVSGARHARSTIVLFSPTDFRYLSLSATGVRAIRGARVESTPSRFTFVERRARVRSSAVTRRTRVVLDFGYPHIPITEVRVTSTTPRYERPVEIDVSQDGVHFTPVAFGRVAAFPGSTQGPLEAQVRGRAVRVTIDNGDDEPLAGLKVRAFDVARAVLAEGGHPRPYRLYYGNARLGPPSYDFARLPVRAAARSATLGAEQTNAVFQPPEDTRSFAAKHGWLVNGALALAALVVAAGGLLALRRR
jgi:hypothetical protein